MTMVIMNKGGFRKPYGYTPDSGYTPDDDYGYGYNTLGYSNYLKNTYGKNLLEKNNTFGAPGSNGTIRNPTFGTGSRKPTDYNIKLGGDYLGYKAAKGAGKIINRAYFYSLSRPFKYHGDKYHSRWWYWLNPDYVYRGKLSPYCDIFYDTDEYQEIMRCDYGYYFNYDYVSPGGRYYDAYYNPNNPNRKNWDEICSRFYAPESEPDNCDERLGGYACKDSENVDMEAFKKLNDAAKDSIDENVPVNATDSRGPESYLPLDKRVI